MSKQIYRSSTNKVIGGVCGGLSEYLDVSVEIIRILWILMTLSSGFFFLVYIISLLIIPQAPIKPYQESIHDLNSNFNSGLNLNNESTRIKSGIILIVIGAMLTLKKIFYIDSIYIYSVVLISVGIYLITRGGEE